MWVMWRGQGRCSKQKQPWGCEDTAAETGTFPKQWEILQCGLWAAGAGGQVQTTQLEVQASQSQANRMRKTVNVKTRQ